MVRSLRASSSAAVAIWQCLTALTVLELLFLLAFFSKTAQQCNCHQAATCLPGNGCPPPWTQNFCGQLHSRVPAAGELCLHLTSGITGLAPVCINPTNI